MANASSWPGSASRKSGAHIWAESAVAPPAAATAARRSSRADSQRGRCRPRRRPGTPGPLVSEGEGCGRAGGRAAWRTGRLPGCSCPQWRLCVGQTPIGGRRPPPAARPPRAARRRCPRGRRGLPTPPTRPGSPLHQRPVPPPWATPARRPPAAPATAPRPPARTECRPATRRPPGTGSSRRTTHSRLVRGRGEGEASFFFFVRFLPLPTPPPPPLLSTRHGLHRAGRIRAPGVRRVPPARRRDVRGRPPVLGRLPWAVPARPVLLLHDESLMMYGGGGRGFALRGLNRGNKKEGAGGCTAATPGERLARPCNPSRRARLSLSFSGRLAASHTTERGARGARGPLSFSHLPHTPRILPTMCSMVTTAMKPTDMVMTAT